MGNLIDFSTIRFEAKHSFVKNVSRSIHNNKNVLKSVSKKHQLFSLHNLVTDSQLNCEYEIFKFTEITLGSVDESLHNFLKQNYGSVDLNEFIKEINKIKYFGTVLENGNFLLIEDDQKINKEQYRISITFTPIFIYVKIN